MFTIDLRDPTVWAWAALWFTVPILSWVWSLFSIYYYKKLNTIILEASKALEETRTMQEQAVAFRTESMLLRTRVEDELKTACAYYDKIVNCLEETKSR